MKGGNLSNELAATVGIRFERLVKTEEGKLNKDLKGYLQAVMKLDINVYVITTGAPRKAMAFMTKWQVPYNQVVAADSTLEIPDIVRENDMVSYYDVDTHIVQNINSRGNVKTKGVLWTRHVVL